MKKIIALLLITTIFGMQSGAFTFEYTDIDVQIKPTILNSRLKKDFAGYEYTITNNSQESINIVNAQIVNGTDGNNAYVKAEGEGALGVTWAIAGPVGLFTFGIGWVAGIIATPIVWIVQKNSNKKTKTESLAYTNTISVGLLNSTENITVMTLVPTGAKPILKLTVMDQKKNLHTLQR